MSATSAVGADTGRTGSRTPGSPQGGVSSLGAAGEVVQSVSADCPAAHVVKVAGDASQSARRWVRLPAGCQSESEEWRLAGRDVSMSRPVFFGLRSCSLRAASIPVSAVSSAIRDCEVDLPAEPADRPFSNLRLRARRSLLLCPHCAWEIRTDGWSINWESQPRDRVRTLFPGQIQGGAIGGTNGFAHYSAVAIRPSHAQMQLWRRDLR